MKFILFFFGLVVSQVLEASVEKIWLIRCAPSADNGQALIAALKAKGVNPLNLIHKSDSLASPLCARDERIQAIYIWEAEREKAQEADPLLRKAPENFSVTPPNRVH